jgi:anti-anti-sigma factor
MNITQQELGDGTLKMTLKGILDLEGSRIADTCFAGLPENGRSVVIDLGEVEYVGSSGFRVLVKAAKTLRERGGKLVVVNAAETARRVMWTTGLDNIVTVANEERTVIRSVA